MTTRIETQNIKESLLHLLGPSANEYSTYLTTLLYTNKKPKDLKLSSQANSNQNIPPPTNSNFNNNTQSTIKSSRNKQEEAKSYIKRTVLSLSREDRQRLRTLKPQLHPSSSILLTSSEATCIKSKELPSLEVLKHRMQWIASCSTESDPTSISDDAVSSLSYGLEMYLENVLENMIDRMGQRSNKKLKRELLNESTLPLPLQESL